MLDRTGLESENIKTKSAAGTFRGTGSAFLFLWQLLQKHRHIQRQGDLGITYTQIAGNQLVGMVRMAFCQPNMQRI